MKRNPNGKTARLLAGLAVTAGLIVPAGVFGGPAFARSTAAASEYEYSGSAQYQYRVQICHLTGSKKHPAHTITVSSAAVAAHLRHGDHLRPRNRTETGKKKHNNGQNQSGTSRAPTSRAHGKSGAHGSGHGKGK